MLYYHSSNLTNEINHIKGIHFKKLKLKIFFRLQYVDFHSRDEFKNGKNINNILQDKENEI